MLEATYYGSVVVLQGVFFALTGQQSTLAVVASTLSIAALFVPIRRRILGFTDRVYYPGRTMMLGRHTKPSLPSSGTIQTSMP